MNRRHTAGAPPPAPSQVTALGDQPFWAFPPGGGRMAMAAAGRGEVPPLAAALQAVNYNLLAVNKCCLG